ncbi:trimeric intracellular cation channel family protein [Mesorhizobium sp. CN2-181]|uniref:trimeric intracellular cation channel family protein n=1 Tax=Mesorhizobium yinganensis TaxID=3157707 RepID=UPI0032B727D4
MNPLLLLDYAGVAVFAATGALAASRKQLDIVGFIFLAAITGIGGGTLRDVILNIPVFWIGDTVYVLICAVVAAFVFFTAHLVASRWKWLLWLDAVGLAAFAAMGAAKGMTITGSPVVAIITGMLTATFGGILRDIVAQEASVLLRPEVYITAAGAGAAAYVVADALLAAPGASAIIAFVIGLFVRGGALWFGWTLEPYKGRPGRRPDDIP